MLGPCLMPSAGDSHVTTPCSGAATVSLDSETINTLVIMFDVDTFIPSFPSNADDQTTRALANCNLPRFGLLELPDGPDSASRPDAGPEAAQLSPSDKQRHQQQMHQQRPQHQHQQRHQQRPRAPSSPWSVERGHHADRQQTPSSLLSSSSSADGQWAVHPGCSLPQRPASDPTFVTFDRHSAWPPAPRLPAEPRFFPHSIHSATQLSTLQQQQQPPRQLQQQSQHPQPYLLQDAQSQQARGACSHESPRKCPALSSPNFGRDAGICPSESKRPHSTAHQPPRTPPQSLSMLSGHTHRLLQLPGRPKDCRPPAAAEVKLPEIPAGREAPPGCTGQGGRRHGLNTNGHSGVRLFRFLLDELERSEGPDDRGRALSWVDKRRGVFRIVRKKDIADRWGRAKNNNSMTYEKFSRSLRYYYRVRQLERVPNQHLVYKFGANAHKEVWDRITGTCHDATPQPAVGVAGTSALTSDPAASDGSKRGNNSSAWRPELPVVVSATTSASDNALSSLEQQNRPLEVFKHERLNMEFSPPVPHCSSESDLPLNVSPLVIAGRAASRSGNAQTIGDDAFRRPQAAQPVTSHLQLTSSLQSKAMTSYQPPTSSLASQALTSPRSQELTSPRSQTHCLSPCNTTFFDSRSHPHHFLQDTGKTSQPREHFFDVLLPDARAALEEELPLGGRLACQLASSDSDTERHSHSAACRQPAQSAATFTPSGPHCSYHKKGGGDFLEEDFLSLPLLLKSSPSSTETNVHLELTSIFADKFGDLAVHSMPSHAPMDSRVVTDSNASMDSRVAMDALISMDCSIAVDSSAPMRPMDC